LDFPLLNLVLLNCLLALSQFVVLRAGVFSVATAGLAAFGAYTTGLLVLRGMNPILGATLGTAMGGIVAALLSIPLARLRGVFQAIATLAFVMIVYSICLNATPVTGGANGLNAIPRVVNTWILAVVVAVVLYVVYSVNKSAIGRAFETLRQDETVAVSFGIPVANLHRFAFVLSGLVAGLAGSLMALHNYSVVPEEFAFGMMVSTLAAVVVGGRSSVLGPLAGAAFLTLLPEIARPLAENRMVITGVLLMVSIIYLPLGAVDTISLRFRQRRAARHERRLVSPGEAA